MGVRGKGEKEPFPKGFSLPSPGRRRQKKAPVQHQLNRGLKLYK